MAAETLDSPVKNLETDTEIDNDDNNNNDIDNHRGSKDRTESTKLSSASPPNNSPPPRRRDRDSRERKDDRDRDRDRDFDRPPPPPHNNRYNNSNNNNNYNNNNNNRDYKRGRLSRSPPPYRGDRRPYDNNSPTRNRRDSPPFKRYRRDDFDDRRGGSPPPPRGGRGGGGGGYGGGRGRGRNDRRFGYDHPRGYDREMGGRQGYGNDRPHGRFRHNGYSGGPSDWEAGRGGFVDSGNAGNIQREGLMTYKQFIQELEDDILPSEAESRYQEYKSEYIATQKRTYFEAHKDEEWLKNKYHPTNLLSIVERRNEIARKVAKDFLLDLHSGSLDQDPGAHKSGQTSEPNSEDETESGKRRRHGRVKAKDADLSAAPKAPTVSSEPRRIQVDIELAQALVTKLDTEKGIEDNILSNDDTDKMNKERSHNGSIGPVIIIRGLTSVKGLEGAELLDTLLTYLWRVHGVDYYGMIEIVEPKGLRHVRAEGKHRDASNHSVEWEKKLDLRWQDRMQGPDPLEVMTAKEKIDAAAADALDPFVRKIRDEKYGWKYGCGAKGCTKLFHASEYVQKHLKLKHTELVMELTSKVREDIYFQNYMSDADAPGGQPVMQQFVPKDKQPRRRPGLENRMNDDRRNYRDQDRNNSERFDRTENSQPDFPSNNDGPAKGNEDEPNFGNFPGQGMSVATFAPDMAPSILMPVPGAGPLGPFVPAPPEVAMRMMREQAPTSFEQPGRNGNAGPLLLPPFRQDPRRLRSYQDLDAPEDEVTVIDYRSL